MDRINSHVQIARPLADRLMAHRWKSWFWGDSSGLEGMLDASVVTGESCYAGFVYGMMKCWIARSIPGREWEYTAPGVALLGCYKNFRDPALLEMAVRHADYLAQFPQTAHGAYVRYSNAHYDRDPELPGTGEDPQAEQKQGNPAVFVDNMHFDGPFFAGLAAITGAPQYRDLALENIFGSISLLRDDKTGLFSHFWTLESERPNGIFWGRGQCWALMGMVLTLEALPESEPRRKDLLAVFRQLSEALVDLQDASGHWHTVVNDPDSYLETSIAAGVATAFFEGARLGLLEESFAQVAGRALEACLPHVKPDGLFDGVSYETYPSYRAEHYRKMPTGAMVPWGQGMLLTALGAHHRYIRRDS